ncbi:hypothetical protein [Ectobacillus panaciterrae]|uniref:hypothetical protein n=1 Tax=Ectobacillus panaciterrae TaxID=363872 RepID=UPI0003F68059|nr:hypothetical protein [Ectobacillus panaciterrae]
MITTFPKQILRFFFLFLIMVFVISLAVHLHKYPSNKGDNTKSYQHIELDAFH